MARKFMLKNKKTNIHLFEKIKSIKTSEDVIDWLYYLLYQVIRKGKIFELVDKTKISDKRLALDYFVKYFNDLMYSEFKNLNFDFYEQCHICGKPYIHKNIISYESNLPGYVLEEHIKICEAKALKKQQRKQKLFKELKSILSKAVYSDSWEEYDSICNKHRRLKNAVARRKWLKLCGLYDIYHSRLQSMKNFKLYTFTNCPYCDKEFEIRKKQLKYGNVHCSSECYKANRSKILLGVSEKKWNEKYGKIVDWKEWFTHKIKNYKHYRRACDEWMRYNLRKDKPDEWKYYQETDDVAIDHYYFPVIEGFKRMTPPHIVSHSDNLRVISISANCKKHDKIYHNGMPDFLVEELNKPIVISRANYDGPPKRQRLIETYHQSNCVRCEKEYYIELSKADENSEYCSITCEKISRYDDIIQSGEIHNMIENRIGNLDWDSVLQLDKTIGEYFDIPENYIKEIRQKDYPLPSNLRYDQERFLIKNAYDYEFPQNIYGPFKIKCVECGEIQEYGTKSSLLRVLGHDNEAYNSQKNIGMCGKCSRSANRVNGGQGKYIRTKELRDKARLTGIKQYYGKNYTQVS
jgi:hypothetical protein